MNKSLLVLLVTLYLTTLAFGARPLNSSFAQTLNTRLIDLMINSSTVSNPDMPLLANLVRLTFHDCVGNGGCNGCLNLRIQENRGLELSINTLKTLYSPSETWPGMSTEDITYADLFAFAGLAAAKQAVRNRRARIVYIPKNLNGFPGNFQWGRQDCSTAPDAPEETTFDFPHSESNQKTTAQFFNEKFGFSSDETVTILGAHSLGQAAHQNSGYQGPWQGRKAELNNVYYQLLTDATLNWKQRFVRSLTSPRDEAAGKYQWTQASTGRGFMLNVDVANVKDIGSPAGNGRVDGECGQNLNSCPDAPVVQTSKNYASNLNLFLDNFDIVFLKMLANCGRSKDGAVVIIDECDLQPLSNGNRRLGQNEKNLRKVVYGINESA
jgi:cytochrome c peroxidase